VSNAANISKLSDAPVNCNRRDPSPARGVAFLLMGGSGTRMGGSCRDKSLVPIAGKPAFLHSLLTIDDSGAFSTTVIVTRDSAQREEIKCHIDAPDLHLHGNVEYVRGGNSRRQSVLNALLHARQSQPNFALIHDAARPLITGDNLHSLLSAMDSHDAAILAHRATDTLVDISGNGRKYLPRNATWHVETPQIFRFGVILDAYLNAEGPLTDDSSALPESVEVKIIENFTPNIKITYPQDLATIEALLGGTLVK
jgi:2-C-methyl-D-erythritol 4-phosphate cytidylyltransferase